MLVLCQQSITMVIHGHHKSQWLTAKHGAAAPTKTFKNSTHQITEKSTFQQSHKLNMCMATA
jgi:hypothetical protein